MLRKKGPNGHNPLAAVGILKALDPHPDPTVEQSEESMTEVSYREEKKERRGFWERTGVKDKDKDRVRDKERQEEDSHADLTRMIGTLPSSSTARSAVTIAMRVCAGRWMRIAFDTILAYQGTLQRLLQKIGHSCLKYVKELLQVRPTRRRP